tara:strand:+ start:38 stop:394 length:357 start_codon:yes stop_codon:yes gene_type:complete
MNQRQIKYAEQRLSDVYKSRKAQIEGSCTKLGNTLSNTETLKALKVGDFKVRSKIVGYGNTLGSYITFNQEYPEKFDKEKCTKQIRALDKEYTKIKDELILGDNQEALQMIKNFEGNK